MIFKCLFPRQAIKPGTETVKGMKQNQEPDMSAMVLISRATDMRQGFLCQLSQHCNL